MLVVVVLSVAVSWWLLTSGGDFSIMERRAEGYFFAMAAVSSEIDVVVSAATITINLPLSKANAQSVVINKVENVVTVLLKR